MYPELIEYGIRREPLHKRQAKAYMKMEEENYEKYYAETYEDTDGNQSTKESV